MLLINRTIQIAELISILQVFQEQFNMTLYKNQNKQIVSLTKDQTRSRHLWYFHHAPPNHILADWLSNSLAIISQDATKSGRIS